MKCMHLIKNRFLEKVVKNIWETGDGHASHHCSLTAFSEMDQ